MKLLALDSSTNACSVAVGDGQQLIERYQLAPRQHAQLLRPMMEECLAEAGWSLNQLDGLAFIAGPGSFTGLRIAASVVQGLAFAADLPVIPVSSLRSLAQSAQRLYQADKAVVAIDARMQEVYWGCYQLDEQGIMRAVMDDGLYAPEQCPSLEGDLWHALGTGWDAYHDQLQSLYADKIKQLHLDHYPHAQDVVTLATSDFKDGLAVSAEQALPIYIRNKVTH